MPVHDPRPVGLQQTLVDTGITHASGGGELLVCPICFNSRKLDESQLVGNARIAGASPLHDWIGEGATVFSY